MYGLIGMKVYVRITMDNNVTNRTRLDIFSKNKVKNLKKPPEVILADHPEPNKDKHQSGYFLKCCIIS